MDLHDKISNLAYQFDKAPISPSSLGKRLFQKHLDTRKKRAAEDPTWASIEERRKSDYGVTFLSEDLTLADWETQSQIEKALTPDPWWLPAAMKLQDVQVSYLVGRVQNDYQLARRGWSDYDVSEMTSVMPRRIGEMLLHMAETAHGWPESDEFPTFEDWAATLRYHGTVLTSKNSESEELLTKWHDMATDPLSDEAETEIANAAHWDAEAAHREKVRTSLRWFADNYELLWS